MAAVTSTPTTVAYRDEGLLAAGISASATTITVGAIYKNPSGVKTQQGFDSTAGYAEISYGDRFEVISFGAASVNATTKVTTLTDVRRGLPQTNTTANFTAGTGLQWPKGATIRVIDYSNYHHQTAFKDKANTFTEDQTIESSNKLILGGASAYVWSENSGTDLKFKDANNSEKTLSQLAAAGGSDEKVAISSNDTTPDYLVNKITGGDGITVTETDDAGDETLDIDIELAADPGLEFSSGALRAKIDSTGITRTSSGLGLPTPSTSGNVLTSNGTAWASAALPEDGATRLGAIIADVASGNIDSGTTTATLGTITIAANSLAAGDIIHVMMTGAVSESGGSDANASFILRMGSTSIGPAQGGAVTAGSIMLDGYITVRAIGASGSITFTGWSNTFASSTITYSYGATPITVDTTASMNLTFLMTYVSGTAASAFNMDNFSAYKINA